MMSSGAGTEAYKKKNEEEEEKLERNNIKGRVRLEYWMPVPATTK